MRIDVVPYDARWAELFRAERARLTEILGFPNLSVEHVGSTSVEGLWAKPIVDVLVGVTNQAELDASPRLLEGAGPYLYIKGPERALPSRRFLIRLRDEVAADLAARGEGRQATEDVPLHERGFHIYVVPRTDPLFATLLRFRDLLRANPAARARYEAHKRELGARTWPSSKEYALAKDVVVEELLRSDAARLGEQRP